MNRRFACTAAAIALSGCATVSDDGTLAEPGETGEIVQRIHVSEAGTIRLLRYLPWIQAIGPRRHREYCAHFSESRSQTSSTRRRARMKLA